MSTRRKILFSLVVLLLFLVGTEGALRALGWPPPVDPQKLEHDKIFWVSDPDLVDKATPHTELQTTFPVSTDTNGLRPPHHGVEKSDGVFRIMTLGCSTTFGWGVQDAESYPARLEARLRDMGYDQVEVINGGQPGYTTFQGLMLWEQVLSEYAPDLVLLGYVVQDARKVAYSDLSQAILQANSDFLKQNVLYNWKLYLALKVARNNLALSAKETGSVYRVGESEYLENLRTFRQKIESIDAQPVHFDFPLEVAGYTEQHRRLLRLEAESAGLPHFDPSEELEEMARNERLYFERDRGHANAAGCDRIAKLVAEFLIEKGLLPERGA